MLNCYLGNKIIYFNFRFSGISEEDMRDVKTDIIEVQAVLMSIIYDKTILVGHSLESDLRVLKVSISINCNLLYIRDLKLYFHKNKNEKG